MASPNEIAALAAAAQDLANSAKGFVSLAGQLLGSNSAHSINWVSVANDVPGSVTDGDLTGYDFSPTEMSNVIGSLDAIKTFIVNNGHLGNFEKLAKPIV